MKITRRQLRRLISEELSLINEKPEPMFDPGKTGSEPGSGGDLPTFDDLKSLEDKVLAIIKPVYDRAFNADYTLKYPEDSFHGKKKDVEKLLSKFRERNEMWEDRDMAHDFLEMLYFLKVQLDTKAKLKKK